ncbi:MAG: class I SAM-dependent methyltransferase [Acidobacteriota bacterium]
MKSQEEAAVMWPCRAAPSLSVQVQYELLGGTNSVPMSRQSRLWRRFKGVTTGMLPASPSLRAGLRAGGAVPFWERALAAVLPSVRGVLPPGSEILEVGYGDGILTCYLATELGWQVTGHDISAGAAATARHHAEGLHLGDKVVLNIGNPFLREPEEGRYDGAFVKTVLYCAEDDGQYARWLRWIARNIRQGGFLVNFETGRSGRLTRAYRRLRRRSYADGRLFTGAVRSLYDECFETAGEWYFGGWSQFFAPLPPLYRLCAGLEERMRARTADNCFLAALVLRRRATAVIAP